jgi:penicillin-binding protein 1B
MASGTGRSAYNSLPSSLKLAGKSGTTNDTRDSWFAGYSGNYVAVVWLGLDNNKVTGLTGSSGALPVWTNVMRQLRQQPVNLKQTDDVQWQWIDVASGNLSAQGCGGAMYIPMLRSTVPHQATSCAYPYYQSAPVSAPISDEDPSQNNGDNMDQYINDSENQMQEDLSQNKVISSGSYGY